MNWKMSRKLSVQGGAPKFEYLFHSHKKKEQQHPIQV